MPGTPAAVASSSRCERWLRILPMSRVGAWRALCFEFQEVGASVPVATRMMIVAPRATRYATNGVKL